MKILFAGLDGFDYHLVKKWSDEGQLRNLAKLISGGYFCLLESFTPPVSPAVWTSILTGVNPARHGVFDFTVMEEGKIKLLTAFRREAPNIFEILSSTGKYVVSVGFPATAPITELKGAVIDGWSSPFSFAAKNYKFYPPEIIESIREYFGENFLIFDAIDQFSTATIENVETAISKLELSAINRAELTSFIEKLLRKAGENEPTITAIYFPEADCCGHLFWDIHDPASPRGNKKEKEKEKGFRLDPLKRIYTAIDTAVGILIERIEPDVVVIASDHGMGGAGTKLFSINRYLESKGLLEFKGKANGQIFETLKHLSTLMGESVPQGLRQLLVEKKLTGLINLMITHERIGGINMKRTWAFSEDLNYAPSVWLNRKRLKNEEKLLQIVHDQLGKVARVYSARQLYEGRFIRRIPDLLLEFPLDGNYTMNLLPGYFRKMSGYVEQLPEKYMGRKKTKSRPGSHRKSGVFIANGENFHCEIPQSLTPSDICPLLLSICGVRISQYFDSAIQSGPGKPIEIEKIHTSSPLPGADYFEIKKRLEMLGYI